MNTVYKIIYPVLAIIIIVIIGIIAYLIINQNDSGNVQDNDHNHSNVDNNEESEIPRTFTRQEVANANTMQNCLIINDSKVYRVPQDFFAKHPGGMNILANECGNDISDLFVQNHGSSVAAVNQIREFYAGELEDESQNLSQTFTMQQINQANSIGNCLVVYNNKVYKIPQNYPSTHPGGAAAIINECGTDITSLFDSSHTTERSVEMLNTFYVGELN